MDDLSGKPACRRAEPAAGFVRPVICAAVLTFPLLQRSVVSRVAGARTVFPTEPLVIDYEFRPTADAVPCRRSAVITCRIKCCLAGFRVFVELDALPALLCNRIAMCAAVQPLSDIEIEIRAADRTGLPIDFR
jgi:hypothetical protein